MKTISLRSEKDLTQAVEEIGLLPLFAGKIPGFSAEEMTRITQENGCRLFGIEA